MCPGYNPLSGKVWHCLVPVWSLFVEGEFEQRFSNYLAVRTNLFHIVLFGSFLNVSVIWRS